VKECSLALRVRLNGDSRSDSRQKLLASARAVSLVGATGAPAAKREEPKVLALAEGRLRADNLQQLPVRRGGDHPATGGAVRALPYIIFHRASMLTISPHDFLVAVQIAALVRVKGEVLRRLGDRQIGLFSINSPSRRTDNFSAHAFEFHFTPVLDISTHALYLARIQYCRIPELGASSIEDLADLTETDVQELGLKPLEVKRFMRAISELSYSKDV
jgi:hypothetical protein